MYQLKLSRSISAALPNFEELLHEAKAFGFETVDFDVCAFRKYAEQETEMINAALQLMPKIQQSGLGLNGVHIPFGRSWDISTLEESVRLNAIEKINHIILQADRFRPVCYIIHGSYEPIPEAERAKRLEQLKRSLFTLTKMTSTPIAVEILPRTCLLNTAEEAIALVDTVPGARICIDVNHFLQETAESGAEKLGARIITTHISDHDYLDEKHWLPKEGRIDWMKLLSAFEKIGYNGAFNYEVSAEQYTTAQIKENFDELFTSYHKL